MDDELLGPLSKVRSISGIDSIQTASLEAIGFGLDTVDMVYRRLVDMLHSPTPPITYAFADAWAIVDWMHRLTGLVGNCRGLTERDEAVRDFLNASRLVENLRHIYQHPAGELRLTAETRRSIWGHLAWQLDHQGLGRMVVAINPFGRWEGEFRNSADASQPLRAQVDRVSLFSPDGEVEIGITGQWESAVRFGLRLDGALQASERPPTDEIMRIRTWLPAPPEAEYPGLARRVP
jgi:hypothetical protein